jgi:hypothetical protein
LSEAAHCRCRGPFVTFEGEEEEEEGGDDEEEEYLLEKAVRY